jgi:hypothetical protein
MPWLPWKYSILLPIAVVALLGTAGYALLGPDSSTPESEPTALASEVAESSPATATAVPKLSQTSPPKAGEKESPSPPATPDTAIAGAVMDASGNPIRGARISDGKELLVTGADGLFSFDPGQLDSSVELRFSASGYHDRVLPLADLETSQDIVLDLQPINALYLNPNQSGSDDEVQRIIDIINTTEANAVVIDIKEEIIYYDSQVSLFVDAGTVRPIMDLLRVIQKFRDNDIYTIARLVVFKDGLVAQANPDMAVLNNTTGDLWRDDNGVAWVNPMVHELWRANADLAVEAAGYGFDEIQYDYVRFPTDGDFSTMDFELENTQANREKSIEGFLALSREQLLPTGVKQSADVFGYTLIVDDDLGIGQNFAQVAEYVDYISPMIYPSHWPDGALGLDRPNDHPYETVEISMQAAGEKLGGDMLKVRPWLQDFSFFDMMTYGDDEVRAQIEATEASGASGWMLWDPNNTYHPGGIDADPAAATPESESPAATPQATPGPASPASGSVRIHRTRGTRR